LSFLPTSRKWLGIEREEQLGRPRSTEALTVLYNVKKRGMSPLVKKIWGDNINDISRRTPKGAGEKEPPW